MKLVALACNIFPTIFCSLYGYSYSYVGATVVTGGAVVLKHGEREHDIVLLTWYLLGMQCSGFTTSDVAISRQTGYCVYEPGTGRQQNNNGGNDDNNNDSDVIDNSSSNPSLNIKFGGQYFLYRLSTSKPTTPLQYCVLYGGG